MMQIKRNGCLHELNKRYIGIDLFKSDTPLDTCHLAQVTLSSVIIFTLLCVVFLVVPFIFSDNNAGMLGVFGGDLSFTLYLACRFLLGYLLWLVTMVVGTIIVICLISPFWCIIKIFRTSLVKKILNKLKDRLCFKVTLEG